MPLTEKQRKLKRKQRRKAKLSRLRRLLAETNNARQRARLIARIKKISPNAPVPGE